MTLAFSRVLNTIKLQAHHQIKREQLSTRARMSQVLGVATTQPLRQLLTLIQRSEGRAGAVVSFLAILELVKESMIELSQMEPMSDIHIRLKRQHDEFESA